jgi:uncharacterized protein YheU (UPF0270 family)
MDTSPDALEPPIEVPIEALNAETLTAIIESFVLREGTDYGAQEASWESKLARVRAQLERGDVKLVFDPNLESITLLTKEQWRRQCPQ